MALSKEEICQKFQDAGLRDLLISIHGLGNQYEENVGVPGAHGKQMQALENLIKLKIPFRFNCVLAKSVLPDLPKIAQLAIDSQARVVNFITFNPFEDQQHNLRSTNDVPSYQQVAEPLMQALDILDQSSIEANVRYFPFCMVRQAYWKQIYNFQQLPYDLHEWDFASWSWTGQQPQRMKSGNLTEVLTLRQANSYSKRFGTQPNYLHDQTISAEDEYRHSALIRSREHCGYQYSSECNKCALQEICDGFHGDYAQLFTAKEARPVQDIERVSNPISFIQKQDKIIEEEDYDWAL